MLRRPDVVEQDDNSRLKQNDSRLDCQGQQHDLEQLHVIEVFPSKAN
jgi:hypothetical protein